MKHGRANYDASSRNGPNAGGSGSRPATATPSSGNVNVTTGVRPTGQSITGCLSLLSSQPPPPRTASDEKTEMTIWEQASAGMYHAKDNGKAGSTMSSSGTGMLTIEDMRGLFDGFRSQVQTDLLGAMRQEIGGLRQELHDGHRCLNAKLDATTQELQALHREARAWWAQQNESSTGSLQRMLGRVCCGSAERRRAQPPVAYHNSSSDVMRRLQSTQSVGSVAEETHHHLVIPTSASTHQAFLGGLHTSGGTTDVTHQEALKSPGPLGRGTLPPAAVPATPPSAATTPQQAPLLPKGLLGPVIALWEEALLPEVLSATGASLAMPSEVNKEPFIRGCEIFVKVLDTLGGNMGSYLQKDVVALKESKADPAEVGYRAWIITELPVHGPSFKAYVDKSAFMGNLWIGWTLDFFVEFLAEVHSGKEPLTGARGAYQKTLYQHHSMMQRTMFNGALLQLPEKGKMYERLKGENVASPADIERELGAFVRVGRPLVKFCLTLNSELDQMVQAERRKIQSRRGR